MAAAAELADIVDQRTGVADAEAATGVDAGEGIARALLIGVFAVVEAEDVGEVVFRVLFRTETAVILAGFEDDGIPGVLAALVLSAVGVPLRPVEGLVVVPEAGDMDIAVGRGCVGSEGCEQGGGEERGEDTHGEGGGRVKD
jgi:hypothetical protein